MSLAIVITTIQAPTVGVEAIAEQSRERECQLFVIGDVKSPANWECAGASYYSYKEQAGLPFASAREIPANSYTRKMLGYLLAARSGCTHIRETDDDNVPYPDFCAAPDPKVFARVGAATDSWINIYSYFSERYIWPRGFPLARLHDARRIETPTMGEQEIQGSIVYQALADGDPDVDAVYRLTAPDTSEVRFSRKAPLLIPSGTWAPFNSQATTWPIDLLPLMYLPSTCSFRMTDIWRSYVAQRLMPGLGAHLVVTSPTVFQERNAHDLMRDFSDEIEGYIGYERFIRCLESAPIVGRAESVLEDLRSLYIRLIHEGFFTAAEIPVLDAWIGDVRDLRDGIRA